MNANTTKTSNAQLPMQTLSVIPISAIYQMSQDDLEVLYRTVKECLRLNHLTDTDNLNVMSVRLALDTCNQVRRIAVAQQSTLSDVIRKAIDAYVKKETIQ